MAQHQQHPTEPRSPPWTVGAAAVAAFFVTLWTLACILVAYRNRHKGDERRLFNGNSAVTISDYEKNEFKNGRLPTSNTESSTSSTRALAGLIDGVTSNSQRAKMPPARTAIHARESNVKRKPVAAIPDLLAPPPRTRIDHPPLPAHDAFGHMPMLKRVPTVDAPPPITPLPAIARIKGPQERPHLPRTPSPLRNNWKKIKQGSSDSSSSSEQGSSSSGSLPSSNTTTVSTRQNAEAMVAKVREADTSFESSGSGTFVEHELTPDNSGSQSFYSTNNGTSDGATTPVKSLSSYAIPDLEGGKSSQPQEVNVLDISASSSGRELAFIDSYSTPPEPNELARPSRIHKSPKSPRSQRSSRVPDIERGIKQLVSDVKPYSPAPFEFPPKTSARSQTTPNPRPTTPVYYSHRPSRTHHEVPIHPRVHHAPSLGKSKSITAKLISSTAGFQKEDRVVGLPANPRARAVPFRNNDTEPAVSEGYGRPLPQRAEQQSIRSASNTSPKQNPEKTKRQRRLAAVNLQALQNDINVFGALVDPVNASEVKPPGPTTFSPPSHYTAILSPTSRDPAARRARSRTEMRLRGNMI